MFYVFRVYSLILLIKVVLVVVEFGYWFCFFEWFSGYGLCLDVVLWLWLFSLLLE